MIERTNVVNDQFKFGLYLNNQPILESVFRADVYNPKARSLNLKDAANDMIRGFRDILSTDDNRLTLDKHLKSYRSQAKFYKLTAEEDITRRIPLSTEEEELNSKNKYYNNSNENFKFVLFHNSNYVIERNFCIKNYNPNARFSYELFEYFNSIISDIEQILYIKDRDLMYYEYETRGKWGYDLDTVRQLSSTESVVHTNEIKAVPEGTKVFDTTTKQVVTL